MFFLYNIGLRNIAKILKIPHQTVSKWIKNEAVKLTKTIDDTKEIEVFEADEIMTYCQKCRRVWIWIALDSNRNKIEVLEIGNRDFTIFANS